MKMEVKEYNKIFYPRYKNAKSVIVNMEHAIEKCENSDAVKYQLACIGWNDDTKQFLLDALEALRVLRIMDVINNNKLKDIRTKIEELPKTYPFVNHQDMYVKEDDVLQIIEKYIAESEDK